MRGVGAGRSAQRGTSAATTGPRGAAGPHNPYKAQGVAILMVVLPTTTEDVAICPGCGGKNASSSSECDWCGRPFVSKGGRLRITIWQVLSSLLLLGLIGAVAALAILNAGRALPPVRVAASTTNTPAPTVVATATPASAAAATGPTPGPTAPAPTPEPTATPQLQAARIANTSGLGVSV